MQPGSLLEHYRIVAQLGAGGMGEVYRAHDEHLHRDVAIKVLPASLASNANRLARFEREARLLAQLEHPNIAAIHGLGRDGDVTFLVMQLASGRTLAERISEGPVPVAEAVEIGRQIAEGLETAHDRGIVHRDLKPANVMVADDGSVKILDFGLAKAMAGDEGRRETPELSASPTMLAGTAAGLILGTAAYMSPEQARGRQVDRRADIWAFGCVLYEMLAGRAPFAGDTVTDILATVVKDEPDWEAIAAAPAPGWLVRLIRRCLDKDPRQRLRDIGEARIALEGGGDAASDRHPAPALASPARRGAIVGALVLLPLAAAALTYWGTRPTESAAPVTRSDVAFAHDLSLRITGDIAGPPALSPDGRRIVFAAVTPADGMQLWIRDLDDLQPRALPGTENGIFPFWSPDGRSIGFFSEDRLRRVDLGSGQVLNIAPATSLGRGGTWHPDGTIYYSPGIEAGILRVNASGGDPTPVLEPDGDRFTTYRWPQILPDGEHLIFYAAGHYDLAAPTNGVWVARRDGTDLHQLLASPSAAVVAGGNLLFVRDSALMAQRLELATQRLVGDPVPLGENVSVDPATWRSLFTAADSGALVYLPPGAETGLALRWVDRQGREIATWPPSGNYQTLELSPDGRRLAAEFQDQPVSQLYLFDSAGRRQQITFGERDSAGPVWSRDGRTIYLSRRAESNFVVRSLPASGGPSEDVYSAGGKDAWPLDVSDAAGIVLVGSGAFYERFAVDTEFWAVPVDGRPATRLLSDWLPSEGAISHDGRSLAFSAVVREGADYEIYVAPLVRTAEGVRVGDPRRQVSPAGGRQPRWSGDDGELFYVQGAGQLTAVTLERDTDGAVADTGEPTILFSTVLGLGGSSYGYDVTPDGQRFITLQNDPSTTHQLVLVSDWRRALAGQH